MITPPIRRILLASTVSLLMVAAGITGAGAQQYGPPPSMGYAPPSMGYSPPSMGYAPAGGTGSASVSIQNFTFVPATLNVPLGTTVTWTNRDSTAHTVTSDSGMWDSGVLAPGATYRYTFNTPGTFGYHCMIHPFMHGTIVVGGTPTPPSSGAVPVRVGSVLDIFGIGFSPFNRVFVQWRRPDGTTGAIWRFTDGRGSFALRLGFNPRHGCGTETVMAFDEGRRTWSAPLVLNVIC